MRRAIRCGIVVAAAGVLLLLASPAHAQNSSIAGLVRDTTGGVMPGVTVEAASPALIEKVRTATTDNQGQYKIVDLRPGTYTVTFTLTGFNTVKREGIILTADFTATVNADLKVGAVEETVTVTGESPLVDTQSVTQRKSLTHDAIDALPTGRSFQNLSVLVPGVTIALGSQDVGGTGGDRYQTLAVHGSRSDQMPLVMYAVDCDDIVDLASDDARRAAGVANAELACAWFDDMTSGRTPPSWALATRLMAGGAAGILVPSFAAHALSTDRNLVLWTWGPDLPHRIDVHDPDRRLPRDQSSWK